MVASNTKGYFCWLLVNVRTDNQTPQHRLVRLHKREEQLYPLAASSLASRSWSTALSGGPGARKEKKATKLTAGLLLKQTTRAEQGETYETGEKANNQT